LPLITDILKVCGIVASLETRDPLYYHRRIVDAIKARDGPRAESLMEEYVERTIRRLRCMRGGDRKSRAGRKTDGKA
jgi:DNA-binding GntR family transcriptional regulator